MRWTPVLRPLLVVALLCVEVSAFAGGKPRKPPAASAAGTYALHDGHDGVDIAAEPGDVAATRPDTRLDYFHHGFLPVRVIFTNNTGKSVSLDDARILFVAADRYTRNAATEDDLDRRMFSKKYIQGQTIPLPAPLPPLNLHHEGINKLIAQDDLDFGFASTQVPPHATLAGYLFYDTRDMDDPVLEHATLELRRVRWADTKAELPAFQIALRPTPEGTPKAAPPGNTQPQGTAAPH